MNEFVMFLRADLNWIWAIAVVVSGSLLVSTYIPTAVRRKSISASEIARSVNQDNAVVIDIRAKNVFIQGHIPGSRNIPFTTGDKNWDQEFNRLKIKKESRIILACESGMRTPQAFKALSEKGFSNIFVLRSGINGWQEAGMPLVKKK